MLFLPHPLLSTAVQYTMQPPSFPSRPLPLPCSADVSPVKFPLRTSNCGHDHTERENDHTHLSRTHSTPLYTRGLYMSNTVLPLHPSRYSTRPYVARAQIDRQLHNNFAHDTLEPSLQSGEGESTNCAEMANRTSASPLTRMRERQRQIDINPITPATEMNPSAPSTPHST